MFLSVKAKGYSPLLELKFLYQDKASDFLSDQSGVILVRKTSTRYCQD